MKNIKKLFFITLIILMSFTVFAAEPQRKINYTAKKMESNFIKLNYPQMSGKSMVYDRINKKIEKIVLDNKKAFEKDRDEILKSDPSFNKMEFLLAYEFTLNNDKFISILFTSYEYTGGAHGNSVFRAYNFDLRTGMDVSINEMLRPGYADIFNKSILKKIADDKIYLLEPFKSIDKNQEYFLTPDALVVFYQQYRYAPYSYGMLEFPVTYTELKNYMLKKIK